MPHVSAATHTSQWSRCPGLQTFSPGSSQDTTLTFTNTSGAPAVDVQLNISAPKQWTSFVSGGAKTSATFAGPVAPRASVSATFKVTSGATIAVAAPLKFAYAAGAQVSGSGITLTTVLTVPHASGPQVASDVPTPGAPNKYYGPRPRM